MERAAARYLLRALEGVECDVIHAHGMYTPGAGSVARRLSRSLGRPFVLSLHGSDVNLARADRLKRLGEVSKDAAAVAFVSRRLRDRVRADGSRQMLEVIPNGVDAELFSPAPMSFGGPVRPGPLGFWEI